MKVELLWNDSNKQDSLIFESVTAIRTNLHLAREQLENTTHAWSRRPYVWPQFMTTIKESGRIPPHTTGKHHSFIGVFKFIGIDEYIQIIFIGPETDEYKLIFISVDQELMNIWGASLTVRVRLVYVFHAIPRRASVGGPYTIPIYILEEW
jgi:hypothetical protein